MNRRRVRLRCGATGVPIGKGWGLYVSAQDNDLGVDRVADGEPWLGAPLPSREEEEAARAAVYAVTRTGAQE